MKKKINGALETQEECEKYLLDDSLIFVHFRWKIIQFLVIYIKEDNPS